MKGGEIYVKKIPSMKVTDIALAVNQDAKQVVVGIRPGEKLHEQMIGIEDAKYTFEYSNYYKILPQINVHDIIFSKCCVCEIPWITSERSVRDGSVSYPNIHFGTPKMIIFRRQRGNFYYWA